MCTEANCIVWSSLFVSLLQCPPIQSKLTTICFQKDHTMHKCHQIISLYFSLLSVGTQVSVMQQSQRNEASKGAELSGDQTRRVGRLFKCARLPNNVLLQALASSSVTGRTVNNLPVSPQFSRDLSLRLSGLELDVNGSLHSTLLALQTSAAGFPRVLEIAGPPGCLV